MSSFASFSSFTSFTLLHWLTLAVVFLAGRLAIEMHVKHTMPLFRAYLIGLAAALIMLDAHGNPWVELAVLVLKCAATAEILGILCSHADRREICWLCVFTAGAAGLMCCLILDFDKQANLAFAGLRYVKHTCQIVLLLVTVCVTLFAWVAYDLSGFKVKHALIMSVLWLDYAVAGIVAPHSWPEWVRIRSGWAAAAIICLGAWLWVVRELDPPEPNAEVEKPAEVEAGLAAVVAIDTVRATLPHRLPDPPPASTAYGALV